MTASSQREKVKVVANKRAKTAAKVSKKAINRTIQEKLVIQELMVKICFYLLR
jgi:hypothetical protein